MEASRSASTALALTIRPLGPGLSVPGPPRVAGTGRAKGSAAEQAQWARRAGSDHSANTGDAAPGPALVTELMVRPPAGSRPAIHWQLSSRIRVISVVNYRD